MAPKPIRSVLLIDDDADDFMIFEGALKEIDAGIEVHYIASSREVQDDGACRMPDLLFLDINMPEKDGFEWLRAIRERGYTVPIIMYSTASNPSYVERAYTGGANVYFPKPHSYRTLRLSLERLLSLNWDEPQEITRGFIQNGQYKVFRLD